MDKNRFLKDYGNEFTDYEFLYIYFNICEIQDNYVSFMPSIENKNYDIANKILDLLKGNMVSGI